jgi:hypothetical protein
MSAPQLTLPLLFLRHGKLKDALLRHQLDPQQRPKEETLACHFPNSQPQLCAGAMKS